MTVSSNETNTSVASNISSSKKLHMPLLGSLALLLSLSAPIAALIGYFYQQGYLAAFDLSHGLFPQNFQDLVLTAFEALLYTFLFINESFGWSGILIWIGIVGLCIAYVAFLGWLSKATSKGALPEKAKPILSKIHKIIPWIQGFIISAAIPGFVMAFLLLLILPSVLSYSIGSKAAKQDISTFGNCEVAKRQCVKLYESGTFVAEGYIIQASDKLIALHRGGHTKVYQLKPESVMESFVRN